MPGFRRGLKWWNARVRDLFRVLALRGVCFNWRSMEEWCFIGAALHLMAAVFASSVYRVPGVGCVVR